MNRNLITVFLLTMALSSYSQKLPGIQVNSIKVPRNFKIDGKTDEWTTFEAYNKATNVFYTIANNGMVLYLIVKTDSYNITNKIIRGGITLTIKPNDKKNEAGATTITFPVEEINNLRQIVQSMRDVMDNTDLGEDEKLLARANKQLATDLRFIKTKGLKNVIDSLTSIYNELGVNTAAALSGKGLLTCEFEIPLTLLNLQSSKFSYNIKLNGPKMRAVNVPVAIPGTPGNNAPVSVFRGQGVVTADNMTKQQTEMVASTMATDFWGEYTLAK